MEVPQSTQTGLVVASAKSSFQELLDYQKELFYSQVDQLQSLVVVQRKLSGINPLSEEMAVGALSMITGKRPRDQLNPRAVRYMQAVFSIKDSVSRKEAHEISALFGITTAQVRNFFTGQRSWVRRYLQTSKEKAMIREAPSPESVCGENSSNLLPCAETVPPLKTAGPLDMDEVRMVPALGDADAHERHFTQNIFRLMRKEETFSGRVKLMEWILKVQTPSILQWFLSRGGILILATWLSEATLEEQTSVLVIILKVLCHVPLHKAIPVHMSAILQNVNRLRFYKTPEISNRARLLLFRWSKIFSQTQVFKIPKQRPSSSSREGEPLKIQIREPPPHVTKLLPPPKQKQQHPSIGQCRERRKVQLLDHDPVEKVPPSSNCSRPLSADDIQKAKMRAQWTRNKNATVPPPFSDSRKAPRDSPPARANSLLRVTWRTPPEMKSQRAWKVMAGEGSKEREIQRNRTRRERELVYVSPQEGIPPHPQEPWDVELDYDDTLTPEIPSDPLSEPTHHHHHHHHSTLPSCPSVSLNGQEADLELLAVLLKNPQLVFALTSGGGISPEERVRLLDTIKARASATAEVSPPSPTPWLPPLPPTSPLGEWSGYHAPPSHRHVHRRTSHASDFNRHH